MNLCAKCQPRTHTNFKAGMHLQTLLSVTTLTSRLTSPEHRVSKIPKTSTSTTSINTEGCNALTNSPLHVPIVLVLQSPPPVTHVTNVTPQ